MNISPDAARANIFKRTLLILAFPTVIPIAGFGVFSMVITQQQVVAELRTKSESILFQVKQHIDVTVSEIDHLARSFSSNPGLSSRLRRIYQLERIELIDYTLLSTVQHLLNTTILVRPQLHSLYLYFPNDNDRFLATIGGLTRLDDYHDTDWFRSYGANRHDGSEWIEFRTVVRPDGSGDSDRLLTLFRTIKSPGNPIDTGVIVINVREGYIIDRLTALKWHPDQILVVIQKNAGIILSTAPSEGIASALQEMVEDGLPEQRKISFEDQTYHVTQDVSDESGFFYFSLVPFRDFFRTSERLLALGLSLILVSLAATIIITARIAGKYSAQMLYVISTIQALENDEPAPPPPPAPAQQDEYVYITHKVLSSFIQNKYLRLQMSERKFRLQAMELNALQAQMNPHFLFNALNTIRWKVIDAVGGLDSTSEMIECLSDILSYSLEGPVGETTIGREILNTKNYVQIEQIRFRKQFIVRWIVDDALMEHKTIRLLLQPLVENAIHHGASQARGACEIAIRIQLLPDARLRVSVTDNGVGIDRTSLAKLRLELSTHSGEANHIGLANTYRRLQLMYGDGACSIHIEGQPNVGFTVVVETPALSSIV